MKCLWDMSGIWPYGIRNLLTGFWEWWGVFGGNDGIEGILWVYLNIISMLLILSKSVTLFGRVWSLYDRNTTELHYRSGLWKIFQKRTCSCSP